MSARLASGSFYYVTTLQNRAAAIMSGLQGFVGSNIMRVGVGVGARQAVLTPMSVGLSRQWRRQDSQKGTGSRQDRP